MELHGISHAIRHGRNARSIFNNDVDINVYVLAIISHRHTMRWFVRDG